MKNIYEILLVISDKIHMKACGWKPCSFASQTYAEDEEELNKHSTEGENAGHQDPA